MADGDIDPLLTGSDDDGRGARAARAAARRRLLEVEPGNARDLDAAAACECSCHPRPGQPDQHGGESCPCQWTEHERREHLAEFHRVLEQNRPAEEARQRADAKALHDAAAELGIEASEEVPGAPWVLVGRVDGRRFYLRERWESYTIVISSADDPDLDPWTADTDVPVVLVRSGDATDLYTAGRVDYRRALGVVADAIRTRLRQDACRHPYAGQDHFCRVCGLLLDHASAPAAVDLDTEPASSGTDAEDFIDGIDPHGMRSGHHLRAIAAARRLQEQANIELHAAVRRARTGGDSWRVIAIALDMTETEVRQQFEA